MRRFTHLFIEMDRTKRTSEKIAAIERYFREAPPEDAAWALYFLSGRKIKRLVPSAILHEAIARITQLPDWLISQSYESVGDYAETLALLHPDDDKPPSQIALHHLVQDRMLRFRTMAELHRQIKLLTHTWSELDSTQRLVFNKLLTGNFRIGVAQTLIIRALANVANVTPAVMAQRFAGAWEPNAESFTQLLHGIGDGQPSTQPYPFLLGYPLDVPLEQLGPIDNWQIEWKYDGLRAQVMRRGEQILIWSRGEELITHSFPEIQQAATDLPDNTVLDGEILAWEDDHPLPFALLQRRINRKVVEATLWTDVPIAFVAFDVLEEDGTDIRHNPLQERRQRLEEILQSLPRPAPIRLSPIVRVQSWGELKQHRDSARQEHVEGVLIKRLDGAYGVGRRKGDWWKWKVDPHTIDAVLIYAQGGSGRRSGLFTDYTFGVWSAPHSDGKRELIAVAKAYSGLTDEEIRQVDRFIRLNTIAKHGPVRVVKPELVFELAFQSVQESQRHKAGVAIRFPRMSRWRTDKKADEADTLETLRALLPT
jgi:DNA ligase-1